MRRFLFATLALAALALPALAEDILPEARKNLWCGLAFGIVTADAPADATPEQQALIQRFAEGGERLVALARETYLAHAYNETSFAALAEQMTAEVMRQVNALDHEREYSFEQCSALLNERR